MKKSLGGGKMLQKYHIFLKSTLWMTSLSCFFLLWQGFSTINLINTLFLVSLFFFCVYGFKWIIDQGTFYTFEYSWQKTKRYVLFFLPKYWSIKDTKDRNNDYDEETGEKIYHTFEEFYEYKQSQKWDDINQLLWSTIIILAFTFILSFLYI